ncbi:protein kinase [Dactylosporangium sp. NPDC000555]|uniref:protein kinase domain-containing protein n=1 Tax=Dactylosporangium sp. NPDC000555 TaxID=3154260 RepID=UPI00331C7FBA
MPGLTGFSVLARGGYATVYRAEQESVGRDVAVKVENRTIETDRDRRRFLREARAAGRMSSHPHVVDLFDAGVTGDGHPYLVMELCDGSYAERMRTAPLSPAEVREVGFKIADALADAHSLGVLHRDVKPANILFSRFGEPALADFGLAILAEWRDVSITLDVLTPAYAPPETFRHATPGPAADVYALCATLYALMRGRPPRWRADQMPSLLSLVDMFNDHIPDLPGCPDELMVILRAGMSNDDAARPTALQLRDALTGLRMAPPPQVILPPLGSPPVEPVHAAPPLPSTPPPRGDRLLDSPFLGGFPRDLEQTVPHQAGLEEPPTDPLAARFGASSAPSGVGAPASSSTSAGPSGSSSSPGPSGGASGPSALSALSGPFDPFGPFGGTGGASVAAADSGSSGLPGIFLGVSTGGPSDSPGLSGDRGDAALFGAPIAPPADPFVAPVKSPAASRRGMWLGVIGGLVAVAVLAGIAVAYGLGGRTPDPTASQSSIAVPPLATCGPVAGPGARCSDTPECFDAKPSPVDCAGRHTWEVFAYGDLPAGSAVSDKKDPAVAAVCSLPTLMSVNVAATNWRIDVLLPSLGAQKAGPTTFRCLAGRGDVALIGEQLHKSR